MQQVSGLDRFYIAAAYFLSLATFILVLEVFLIGQPPKHCHYFVPVKAHPGIYSCSEYPRPLAKP